jgi:hypothetical protein
MADKHRGYSTIARHDLAVHRECSRDYTYRIAIGATIPWDAILIRGGWQPRALGLSPLPLPLTLVERIFKSPRDTAGDSITPRSLSRVR